MSKLKNKKVKNEKEYLPFMQNVTEIQLSMLSCQNTTTNLQVHVIY